MGRHPMVEVKVAGKAALLVAVQRRLELGRECDGLLLDDPLASRRHLALTPEGGRVVAEDLGSSNGTLLNGVPIVGRAVLGPGDELLVGETAIRLVDLMAGADGVAAPGAAGPSSRQTLLRSDDSGDPLVVRPLGAVGTSPGDPRATSIERLAVELSADAAAIVAMEDIGAQTGGTVTFAFSDIEASTERASAIGDQRWFSVLSSHNSVVERTVRSYGGQVVKSIGDGYMLTFPSARRGLHAAAAIQRAMASSAAEIDEAAIRVRIGLHTGEAIESGGDLFGLHVNTAARIANLAGGGEILVSAITRAIAEAAGDLRFGAEEQVELKGIPGTHGVSRLLWGDPAEAPAPD